METFALYLMKSVIWLTGFALVYILFLRNERFFILNRLYLIAGILASFFFPFITFSYKLVLPVVSNIPGAYSVVNEIQNSPVNSSTPDMALLLLSLYLTGILFVTFIIIKQSRSILKTIKKSGIITTYPVKLIRTAEFTSAFSFFSYVFVNPSITHLEIKEIVNHEMVHIRQKHWLDLALAELLCILQWFNPFIWIYIRLIRQNHEYLADEMALQRTSDPAIYKAVLLNQLVGSPVISLVNSFNYSLNKKRFNMMKNIISSPYRKMKILFILPVAAIVFYSFARPEYQYTHIDNTPAKNEPFTSGLSKEVKGTVIKPDGSPLQGATIIVKGTAIGTSSDIKGFFRLEDIMTDNLLIVTFVGYKSKVIKPQFTTSVIIEMERDTVKYLDLNISIPPPPPPPPPPQSGIKIRSIENPPPPPPLIVVDGIITNIDVNTIDPETIESVHVLKDESATVKYGEKGKDGVVEITLKKSDSAGNDKKTQDAKGTGYAVDKNIDDNKYVVIEELPEFPGGGKEAMINWIVQNLKYPDEAYNNKVTGKVYVNFMIASNGKVKNVQVNTSVHPLLDSEAKRVISSMPDWKPGSQNGKPVDVQVMVPVEFKL